MYHRYLRNEQGQYRRESIPDPLPERTPPAQMHPTAAPPPSRPEVSPPPPRLRDNDHAPAPNFQLPFLSRFFPNMDAGDLLLLMILLLLLSEGNEDASSMAMTLAIFLFLQ